MKMPIFDPNAGLVSQAIKGTNYSFSATRIDAQSLGATEYTLAEVVLDVSGSTDAFRKEMETVLKAIIQACRQNPRADNMMLRVVKFDHRVAEVHGFKPLTACNEGDYTGCLGHGGGTTSLYDALYNSVKSATLYGDQLVAKDYDVNGVVFIVTDGQEYPPNASTATRRMVKDALEEGVKGESLESLNSILIGVNSGGALDQFLTDLQVECGITQYVPMGDATAKSLAKLASFISRSISSTSQALGTGGPSQSLVF